MQQLNFGVRGFQVPAPATTQEQLPKEDERQEEAKDGEKLNKAVSDVTIKAAASDLESGNAVEAEPPQTEEQKILELTR